MVVKEFIELSGEARHYPKAEYAKALKKYVRLVSSCGDVLAVYQAGSVSVPGVSDIDLLVVLKDELDGERSSIRYLLASTPRLSARNVVLRYKSRWIIETLFWDLKQHLGISNHQGITLCASEKHVAAASLAVMVLDHVRINSGLSLGETKRVIQRMVFIKTEKRGFQLATFQPAPAADLDEMEEIKKMLRRQLWQVTGVRICQKPLLEKAA